MTVVWVIYQDIKILSWKCLITCDSVSFDVQRMRVTYISVRCISSSTEVNVFVLFLFGLHTHPISPNASCNSPSMTSSVYTLQDLQRISASVRPPKLWSHKIKMMRWKTAESTTHLSAEWSFLLPKGPRPGLLPHDSLPTFYPEGTAHFWN